MSERYPKVGIGVNIFKDGKMLLGRRKSAQGDGQYASPGGHLEFGETFEDCARREAMEETGLEIENIRIIRLANLIFPDVDGFGERHYVDIGIVSDWKSGTPKNKEPEKCYGWDWYDPDNLPQPMFTGTLLTIQSFQNGTFYVGTIRP